MFACIARAARESGIHGRRGAVARLRHWLAAPSAKRIIAKASEPAWSSASSKGSIGAVIHSCSMMVRAA
jgi:hypothetical protein